MLTLIMETPVITNVFSVAPKHHSFTSCITELTHHKKRQQISDGYLQNLQIKWGVY